MSATPVYYRPFIDQVEDTENTSDTDSDSDESSNGFNDNSVRGLDDPRYAIVRAAGPSLDTPVQQLFYQSFKKPMGYDYTATDAAANSLMNFYPASPPTQTVQTTLLSINSTNRDARVYPLSTYFSLKTPRVYKNIVQIQFVQINFPYFLNSLTDISGINNQVAQYAAAQSGFSFDECYACLGNTTRSLSGAVGSLRGGSFSEQGRTNPTAPSKPLIHTFQLSGGAYDKSDLANAMNQQLNTTPPFNLITYAEHRQLFQTTKQIDHLFNDPGIYYYSPPTRSFLNRANKSQVVQDYLPSATTTSGIPTERETFVAYFFPVLRAALYTDYDAKFLDLTGTSLSELQLRALNSFEGLASDYYYQVLYTNVSLLRKLRRVNTFEYAPINTYQWAYNPSKQSISVVHTDLHPTIQKDIRTASNRHFQQALQARGYTLNQYSQFQTQQNAKILTVNTLADQVNRALVEVGVPYNTYSAATLANPQTVIQTQPKRELTPNQITNSDESLFALTREPPPLHAPSVRSFPATFGSITLEQLAFDASCAATSTRSFTPPYAAHLSVLNQSQPFAALYSSFVQEYTAHAALTDTIRSVTTSASTATKDYVTAKYGTVFPPSLLTGTAYLGNKGTGGVMFYNDRSIHYASSPSETDTRSILPINSDTSDCCQVVNADLTNFYSCLPAEYVSSTTFYQLFGTTNPNNILNIYVTEGLTTSPSTNNIYLQLNTEQPLNNMDIVGNENYAISNESTGECKKVFGKLLTQGSVSSTPPQYTQTIVQVPAKFSTTSPLASLDHFTFNFFLDTMVPLSKLYPFVPNDITTNWNAILQIDELVGSMTT
jgi:hypothetical protein